MHTDNDVLKSRIRCISHEIRNQISICDVYCEIMRKQLAKNNVSIKPVDNAINCINKSLKIISNSILDLKSLNEPDCKIFDLSELLIEAVELAKIYIYEKKIDISLEVSEHCSVFVDENKFLACLINLIKNAIEAIEVEGWIDIKTEMFKDFVLIHIKNNGEKIPEEYADKIFEEGLTTKCYGSGLGLFICKNNLKTMNADLKLVKSTNEITEFEITLPLKKS